MNHELASLLAHPGAEIKSFGKPSSLVGILQNKGATLTRNINGALVVAGLVLVTGLMSHTDDVHAAKPADSAVNIMKMAGGGSLEQNIAFLQSIAGGAAKGAQKSSPEKQASSSSTIKGANAFFTPVKGLSQEEINSILAKQRIRKAEAMADEFSTDYPNIDSSGIPDFKNTQSIEAYYLDPAKGNDPYLAVASRMEAFMPTLYSDPANALPARNIGIGYSIDNIGWKQAKADLQKVGMSADQINILETKNKARYGEVKITGKQAVQLFKMVVPRYKKIAQTYIGDDKWAVMSENQRAALTYLAYQAGGRIHQFKSLKTAIKTNDTAGVEKHLVTKFRRDGAVVVNTRFQKIVGAMWKGIDVYASKMGIALSNKSNDILYKIKGIQEARNNAAKPDALKM